MTTSRILNAKLNYYEHFFSTVSTLAEDTNALMFDARLTMSRKRETQTDASWPNRPEDVELTIW